jgi:hypothetical protein
MHRVGMAAVVAVTLLLVAGAALVSQINAVASNRLDAAGYDAPQKAAEADRLHKEGKHAEAENAAKEGLAKLGL